MKMNKKNLSSLATLFVLGLILTGCSTGNAGEKEVSLVESTQSEAKESTSNKEEDKTNSQIGKRSNPVPLGETVEFPVEYANEDWSETFKGRATLSISDIIRGQEALDILMSENEFNETAPEGYEWMIFTTSMKLIEGDEDYPYVPLNIFTVIDESGSEIPQDLYATFDGNEFGFTDIFPGGTATGRIAKVVKVDEQPLLSFSEGLINTYYFSTKE